MKLKLDFIANSSSAAYIMSFNEDDFPGFEKYVNTLDNDPEATNEGVQIWKRLNTKKELYEYATDRPYDWASKAMAARVVNMEQEAFDKSLKAINDGYKVIVLAIDYNVRNTFERSKYYSDVLAEIW
jgi:hypothetical protein